MLDDTKLGQYSQKLLKFKVPEIKHIHYEPPPRILRVICQKPYHTGSGINLVNLVKQSKKKGLDQFIIFGQSLNNHNPFEGIIDSDYTKPVFFNDKEKTEEGREKADIPFPVAGMSDQMPYKSTKFSEFNEKMLEIYLSAFSRKINEAIDEFQPNLIHSHHLWLVTALCKVLHSDIPIIATCHNTALRQMILAPHLKRFVIKSIRLLDKIAVINKDQKERVKVIYDFNDLDELNKKFFYIGQGINTDLFYPENTLRKSLNKGISRLNKIIYVGKLSFSKGVPQLIQAFDEISRELKNFNLQLFIVGSGHGYEKDRIIEIARGKEDRIQFLGQLNQEELSTLFKECGLFVLPSFYDGFPKVLLESLASGCKAIITDLPGIKETLQKACGNNENIAFIPMPKMKTIDEPEEEALPDFIKNLRQLIKTKLLAINQKKIDIEYSNNIRKEFGWQSLFEKYLAVYNSCLNA